jgi:hypothetical protein
MTIAGKPYRINELSIGKVKALLLQLSESLQVIQESFKDKNIRIDLISFNALLIEHGDVFFDEIAKIFNIIFEHGNKDFKPFDGKFIEDNISIPDMKELIIEVIKQNGMEGTIPFFQEFFQRYTMKINQDIEKILKKGKN